MHENTMYPPLSEINLELGGNLLSDDRFRRELVEEAIGYQEQLVGHSIDKGSDAEGRERL